MLFVLFKYIIVDFLNLVISKLLVMLKFINVIWYVLINIFIYYDIFISEWFLIWIIFKFIEVWCRLEIFGLRKDVIIINNGN